MYLVLDIGGTFVKYATMTSDGNIMFKDKQPIMKDSKDSFFAQIHSIIEEQQKEGVSGVAISCPGTVDSQTGMVYYGGSFPFLHEVNVLSEIQEEFPHLQLSIENDAKCAALAELWLGSVKGMKDALVLILGSGIGGGIIIDGKLHKGASLSAGEVSYMNHRFNPETKEVGYFGLDCSAVEMVKRIAKCKGLKDETDGEAVFEYIINKDSEALKIFDEYCSIIASQIINLQYVVDPEVVAIGGGISAQPILIEKINEAISKIKAVNPFHIASPRVVPCHFRNDANLYGALYHFSKTYEFEKQLS